MEEAFQRLVDTIDLWLPALTLLTARFAATRTGRAIGRTLKQRLTWLKDPEAGSAFRSAFETGVRRYEKAHGSEEAAQAVAAVLRHVAERDTSSMDREDILCQVFADTVDIGVLAGVVKRYAFAIEGAKVSLEEVSCALETLIVDYLRPAFRAERYFTERVGFAEVIGLLNELRDALTEPGPDVERLRQEYCAMVVEKYELISMQGISPKVQNQTIGIRMEDVFIPLEAKRDERYLFSLQPGFTKIYEDFEADFGGVYARKSFREALKAFRDGIAESEDAQNWDLDRADVVVDLRDKLVRERAYLTDAGLLVAPVSGEGEAGIAAARELKRAANVLSHSVRSMPEAGPVTLKDLLQYPRVVVRGHPGAGKSTITRYVAWAAAGARGDLIGEAVAGRLPLRVRAIEFGDALERGSVETLDEYLVEREGRFGPLVKQAVAGGNALLLLDGLDEVGKAELLARVKERVDDFVADPAFADNHTLITTRIVGYERSGTTGRFPHFTVAELDDDQIAGFVNSWYGAIHDEMPAAIDVEAERNQLLEAIMRKESIHRMARNPLLLTIIALIKWQGRALPDQRVLLYDAAAQTLIRSWPMTQRRVELDELFIREWLAPAALAILEDQTSDLVDEYSLMETLVASMRGLKSMTDIEAKQSTQELLQDVSLHTGILLPRGSDRDGRSLYGFLHQTFAEYMTAYHLAGKWEDGELDLLQYAHDMYWREVLLLMAGHLGTQRRAKAGKLIQEVCDLGSSPYEGTIHRDLLLAGLVLGDGVPVGPASVVEEVVTSLLRVWTQTQINPLRKDVEDVLRGLRNTEYAGVAARLAIEAAFETPNILTVAGAVGAVYFVDSLVNMLNDEDLHVRYRAAELLAEEDDPRGVEALVELLAAEDERTRYQAARNLAERDDARGVEVLVELLAAEDEFTRYQAERHLAEEDDPRGVEALVELLVAEDESTRYQAARNLAERDDARGVEVLVELLVAEDESTRYQAARFLAERDDARGVEALVELLAAEDEWLRRQASDLLAERHDAHVVGRLAELLAAEDEGTRYHAARILAERDDACGVEVLVELLAAENELTRYQAARLLAERDDDRGVEVLVELLAAENEWTRYQAAQLLTKRDDDRAVEALLELLSAEHELTRYEAARLLADRGHRGGVEGLVELLRANDDLAAYMSAKCLAQLEDPIIVDLLADRLGDDDAQVRYLAAVSLALARSPEASGVLRDRAGAMLTDVAATGLLAAPWTGLERAYSVADVVYHYLAQQLTPTGELDLPRLSSGGVGRQGA